MGACIVSAVVAAMMRRAFGSGPHLPGHAGVLAAAKSSMGIYESDGLIERSANMGDYLWPAP